MSRLGERIRARRKELNWTLGDLAAQSGLSKSYLCELENGKRSIGAESLQSIGEALDLSMDFLMGDDVISEPIPNPKLAASLAEFGRNHDLTFRTVVLLANLQRVIADRPEFRDPEAFDWQKLYEAIKGWI